MLNRRALTIRIRTGDDTGTLLVEWAEGKREFRPYAVQERLITEEAATIRRALQSIVDAARDSRTSEYGVLTRRLAQCGYALKEALFSGYSEADREQSQRVQNWLSKQPLTAFDTVDFRVYPRKPVPWGLIYDKQVERDSGGPAPDPKEFSEFWCEKYSTVVHYNTVHPDESSVWPEASFQILAGAHKAIWAPAWPEIPEEERDYLTQLLSLPDQPKFSFQELYEAWNLQRNDRPYGLLNLYCHGSASALNIGNETISAARFRQRFSRKSSASLPPTLVFLAACQTAIGDLEGDFLDATSGPGFCGFIGAEAMIPDLFTLRFLTRFLASFYGGFGSVSEVMHNLRREHWPLSLVFSLCCRNDLRLEPQVYRNRDFQQINLSTHPVAAPKKKESRRDD
jgi:hypothetical protein